MSRYLALWIVRASLFSSIVCFLLGLYSAINSILGFREMQGVSEPVIIFLSIILLLIAYYVHSTFVK